jgi:hypothetical protein
MCEEHHHNHGHTHEEEKGATLNDLAKLRILLPHWIEHNDEHAESFQEWAERARKLGQEETARWIKEAVERMAVCNEALAEAMKALEKG